MMYIQKQKMTRNSNYPTCDTPNCNDKALTNETMVGYSCYYCYFRRHGIEKDTKNKSSSKGYGTVKTQSKCSA